MPKNIATPGFPEFARSLTSKKAFRPTSVIERDFFDLNIKINWITKRRLAWYPPEQYRQVKSLASRIYHLQNYAELKVDPSDQVSHIDFTELREEFLLEQITVVTLDLTGLQDKINRYLARQHQRLSAGTKPAEPRSGLSVSPALTLFDIISDEREKLRAIAADASSTTENIFDAIDLGKERLGFLNVVLYRPLEDGSGKWVRSRQTRKWESGPIKYNSELGGSLPVTTLKSCIEGKALVYEVDINEPESFARVGLVVDEVSRRSDLHQSHGPGKMLFYKLVSSTGRVEGVVLIHNRVGLEEPVPQGDLLPANPAEAKRIKVELELYFEEAVRAIGIIRARTNDAIWDEISTVGSAVGDEQTAPRTRAELSRKFPYSPANEIKEMKLRDGRRVQVEVFVSWDGRSIRDTMLLAGLDEGLESLRRDLCVVAELATGINKDKAVGEYLANGTIFLGARDLVTGELIGYVMAEPFRVSGIPSIYVWADHQLDEYHHMGLGTALNSEMIEISKRRIGLRLWQRIFINFRTWSPAALRLASRFGVRMFPQPNSDGKGLAREPFPEEARLYTHCAAAKLHSPIDPDTAVMKGSVRPAKKINWLGIPRFDNFFIIFMNVFKGDSALITLRLPPFFEWLNPLHELWVRFGLAVTLPLRSLPLVKKMFKQPGLKINWGKYFQAYNVLMKLIPYRTLMKQVADWLEIDGQGLCLDLGSGTGNQSIEIKARGARVISVDNNEVGMAVHRTNDPEAAQLLDDLEAGNGHKPLKSLAGIRFNRISATHVVNYVKDREALYKTLREHATPDCIMVLAVLRPGFRPLKVLTEHMRLEYKELRKTNSSGRALQTVFANFIKASPQLKIVGDANQAILESAAGGTYELLSEEQIRSELDRAGWEVISLEVTYAGQDYIVKARPKRSQV